MIKIKKHVKKKSTYQHSNQKETSPDLNDRNSLKETISLCMIVKNEEANIAKCLTSVKELVDEMIVVDTGSTDKTKTIAEAHWAKIYDFAWTGNFGEARNYSFSKATCDWILIIDADEVISPSDHELVKTLVKNACLNPVAFMFIVRNYVSYPNTTGWIQNDGQYMEEEGTGFIPDEGVGIRLFPNNKNIRYDCYVHGNIAPSLKKCGIKIIKCNIPIHHYGYLNQEKVDFKGEMYYLSQKNQFAQKKELTEEDIYYLGMQAGEIGKYEEAVKYLEKLIVMKPNDNNYYNLGLAYFNIGRYGNALSSFKQALQLNAYSRDIIVAYSQAEICNGNAKVAIFHLEHYLHKDPSYQMAILALAVAYFCNNKKTEGIDCIEKLRRLNFGCAYYFSEFAKMLISAGQIHYAILLLEAAIESNNKNDDTAILLTQCYQQRQYNDK